MTWLAYVYDFSTKKIEVFNIFEHYSFRESVEKLKRKKLSKNEFAEKLKRELMYYFWSKCEYEVVITSFPPNLPIVGRKADVYEQVSLNWDIFVDYVWGANGL